MTFSECKTAFIKPRLSLTESLIWLHLPCHDISTALCSANLFIHCELDWRLFTPVNRRIPGDLPQGSTNLDVSISWYTLLLLTGLPLLEWESFKPSRQNRWPQQISASSRASHAISFKLPSLATALIILSHPILYMQMSSYYTKKFSTLGLTFCLCVYV